MPGPIDTAGDTIQATINISIAHSRRLISSWLPSPTPEEIASQKTNEQLAKEDAELFTPMPPRLGLGAPIPKDFLQSTDPKSRRLAVSTNDALKRKIMGHRTPASTQEASKPRPHTANDQSNTNNDDAEEEEEEEGRSSLGRAKRRKVTVSKKKGEEHLKKEDMANGDGWESDTTKGDQEERDEGTNAKTTKTSSIRKEVKTSYKGPVRFGTYLDVHKTEKAKKRKKKRPLLPIN